MNIQIARRTIGLALGLAMSIAAQPAMAADWGGGSAGGIKDYGGAGGVPVPAPVPIPDYAPSWYFRLDAGLGVINDPGISESGFLYGEDSIDGPTATRGTQSSWFEPDFNTFLTLGGGVGYYFNNGWRMDATVEKRSNDQAYISGQDEYVTYGYDAGSNWVPIDNNGTLGPDQHTRVSVAETIDVDGTVWMANLYYDLGSHRGFTPYIGGGIGFVWNEITRRHTSTVETCDAEPAVPNGGCGFVYNGGAPTTVEDSSDHVSLAASAMAGLSYDISDITAVDIGYRYLYLAGTGASLTIGSTESTVKIDDQHVHQVRAGLRFNVN
jgi:opacity protein-like surface antigen